MKKILNKKNQGANSENKTVHLERVVNVEVNTNPDWQKGLKKSWNKSESR